MWNKTNDPTTLQYTKVGDFEVAINEIWSGLEIFIKGYGMYNCEIAPPIYLELSKDIEHHGHDPHPTLYVWDNINDEDYTQKLSLIGAAEILREEEHES